MKKLSVLSLAALIGLGALTSTPVEARDRGGAVAAGVIGGLAAGALIGAAASSAHAAPVYSHSYPVHGYGYGYRPAYYARSYHRPVVVRQIVEDDVEECRVILKRRYNAYGDLVVKRIRVCD